MTDNAELIAEARDVLSRPIRADHESEEARGVIQRLADALEASERDRARATESIQQLIDALDYAERRAEDAERQRAKVEAHTVMLLRNGRQVLDQRNQLADVIEKVREWADRNNETGYGTGTGASALEILDILATAPADALREHDALVWDEGADAMAEHIDNGAGWEIQNPYREEQS